MENLEKEMKTLEIISECLEFTIVKVNKLNKLSLLTIKLIQSKELLFMIFFIK